MVRGGVGVVYLLRDSRSDRDVAGKALLIMEPAEGERPAEYLNDGSVPADEVLNARTPTGANQ